MHTDTQKQSESERGLSMLQHYQPALRNPNQTQQHSTLILTFSRPFLIVCALQEEVNRQARERLQVHIFGAHCTLHLFLCLSLSSWESTKQTWKDIKFCNSDVLTVSDFGFCSARYTFLVAHTYRKRGQLPDRRACGLNNATGIDVLSRNLKKQIQLASQLQGK